MTQNNAYLWLSNGWKMRTVLITGGARGIGAKIKEAFEGGAYTVIAPSRAELDLADRDSVRTFLEKFGNDIDILINNAGENVIRPIPEIDLSAWDRLLQINLTSPLMLIQHFAPRMAKNNFGRILNISSAYSRKARPGRGMYSCSKAALDALTRTTAVEFAATGVLVNSLCPGFVDTELTRKNNSEEMIRQLVARIPAGRMAQATEIAETALFLASERNTYITGQTIDVDGAFSIA